MYSVAPGVCLKSSSSISDCIAASQCNEGKGKLFSEFLFN